MELLSRDHSETPHLFSLNTLMNPYRGLDETASHAVPPALARLS